MVNLDLALARIARIQLLIEGWQHNGNASGIERKIVLDQLSALYDELALLETGVVQVAVESKEKRAKKTDTVKTEQAVEPIVQVVEPVEKEQVVEPVVQVVEEIKEPKLEKKIAEVPEEKVAVVEKKEESPKLEKEEKKIDSKPQEQHATVKPKVDVRLGEQLNNSRKSLYDSFGTRDDDSATKLAGIKNLPRAIGLNDRFLFTKELFDGNHELFKKTIDALNSCETIEEAFVHIHQNFQWSDDNPVVKQLVLLLRRRFS